MPAPSVRTGSLNDALAITRWQGSSAQPGFWWNKGRDGFIRTCNQESIPQTVHACMCAQLCLTLCDRHGQQPTRLLCGGFPRQGHWSGLPFPFPGHLLDPGIEPRSPVGSLPPELPGKPRTSDWHVEKFDYFSLTWEALSLGTKLLMFVLSHKSR